MLAILTTPTFAKAVKKLHSKDKDVVDKAVQAISTNSTISEEKKGDLVGIFVYKFKVNKQEVLLSYQLDPDKFSPASVLLLSIGSYENFYTELKRTN